MPDEYGMKNKKLTGLALGSGGAKGIAHISVIEYLEKKSVKIDMIAGSSAGALIGAIYLCGNLSKFKSELISFTKADLISMISPIIPVSGLINSSRIMKWLEKFIPSDINIESLPIPLTIIASDFTTGDQILFSKGNLLSAVRASISVPGIFQPVNYAGKVMIDGGVVNPLPVDILKSSGASKIIAVNLHPSLKTGHKTKPKHEEFKPAKFKPHSSPLISGISGLADKINYKLLKKLTTFIVLKEKSASRNLPNIFEIISQTIDIMGLKNTELLLKYCKPDVLIEPDLLSFGTLEFYRAFEALVEGNNACKKKDSEITELLK